MKMSIKKKFCFHFTMIFCKRPGLNLKSGTLQKEHPAAGTGCSTLISVVESV